MLCVCAWALRRPGLAFPLGFLGLIVAGTPLLMLDAAVRPGIESLSFLDAMFIAVSATCTTGLTVVPPENLSPLAYVVIGVLIQCGGVGLVLFTAALIHKLQHRITVGPATVIDPGKSDYGQDNESTQRFLRQARAAVVLIMLIELVGALLLMPMWHAPDSADGVGEATIGIADRFGRSVFHSVSAFCNAGFTMQNDSFAAYRYSVPVHLVFAGLIVAGGLGMPVLTNVGEALRSHWRSRGDEPGASAPREPALSQHTRIALSTSACLYLAGVVVIGVAQLASALAPASNESLAGSTVEPAHLAAGDAARALADGSFLSITSRTAGFATAPMDELAPPSRMALMVLMTIGASPGGTGGGMKTTTFAVIVLTLVATLRRQPHSLSLRQRMGDVLVRQAVTLAGAFVSVIALATLLLTFSEPFPFERLLFEAISAASNTGLTLGITADLTAFGKSVIAGTMFSGCMIPLMLLGELMLDPQQAEAPAS